MGNDSLLPREAMQLSVMLSITRSISSVGSSGHCSSKVDESVARVVEGGLRADKCRPRASQTCSIGLRSSDRAGHCML
ncbi:hypothetical protein TNCV_1321 [Trichonephila clavipes]|nr:hypothetical protein TNCV_1321 [Trichonephila clavipes]